MTKHYEKAIAFLTGGKIKTATARPVDALTAEAVEKIETLNQEGVKFRDMYIQNGGGIVNALTYHDGKAAEAQLPPIRLSEGTAFTGFAVAVKNERTLKGNKGGRVRHNKVAGLDQNGELIIDNEIYLHKGGEAIEGLDIWELMSDGYETTAREGFEPKATYTCAILKNDGKVYAAEDNTLIADRDLMFPVQAVSGLKSKPFVLRDSKITHNNVELDGLYRFLSRPMLYSLPRFVSSATYSDNVAMNAYYETYVTAHNKAPDIWELLNYDRIVDGKVINGDWSRQWQFYYRAFPIVLAQKHTTHEIVALDAETGEDISFNVTADMQALYDALYYKPTEADMPKKVLIPPMFGEKLREVDYYGDGLFVGIFGDNEPIEVQNIIKNGGVSSGGVGDETIKPGGKGRTPPSPN
jgi:hypothetical protein